MIGSTPIGATYGPVLYWLGTLVLSQGYEGSIPFRVTMNVDEKELEKINNKMVGWTIERVESGHGENLFIIHLSKGKNKRSIILCGNDLGGWMGQ